MKAPVYISISDPDGNSPMLIDADAARWSSTAPGGCFSLTFSLKRKVELLYPDIGYNYIVTLSDADGIFWKGQVEDFFPILGEQDEMIDVVVLGGYVNADDEAILTETIPALTSIEDAVETIVVGYMPMIAELDLTATGRVLTDDVTLEGQRPRTAIETLCKFGTSANLSVYPYVWPDGTNNAYLFVLAPRPSAAGYTVLRQNFIGRLGFTGAMYGNRQRVLYDGGTLWASAEDTAQQGSFASGGVNRIRDGEIIEVPEVVNGTDAANIASTGLALISQQRILSEGGEIKAKWGITDSNNQQVPLWRVRAGELLYIQGLEPAGELGSIDWHNAAFIAEAEYDDESATLRLTFERLDLTIDGLEAKLLNSTEI